MPQPRFTFAAATAADGRIFLVGGATDFAGASSTLTVYNPADDSYRALSAPPLAFVGQAAASFVGGRLLVAGGSLSSYDPDTDAWSVRADDPSDLINRALAAGPDGRLYAFGGNSSTGRSPTASNADSYDPQTDVWTALPSMPFQGATDGFAAVNVGRLFYVVGPEAAVFDLSSQQWSSLPAPPTPRYSLGAAADPDGRLVTIGGFVANAGGSSAVVEIYDPPAGRWLVGSPAPIAVGEMATTPSCGGSIFVFGGDSNGTISDRVQVYAADKGWTISR